MNARQKRQNTRVHIPDAMSAVEGDNRQAGDVRAAGWDRTGMHRPSCVFVAAPGLWQGPTSLTWCPAGICPCRVACHAIRYSGLAFSAPSTSRVLRAAHSDHLQQRVDAISWALALLANAPSSHGISQS